MTSYLKRFICNGCVMHWCFWSYILLSIGTLITIYVLFCFCFKIIFILLIYVLLFPTVWFRKSLPWTHAKCTWAVHRPYSSYMDFFLLIYWNVICVHRYSYIMYNLIIFMIATIDMFPYLYQYSLCYYFIQNVYFRTE